MKTTKYAVVDIQTNDVIMYSDTENGWESEKTFLDEEYGLENILVREINVEVMSIEVTKDIVRETIEQIRRIPGVSVSPRRGTENTIILDCIIP